MLNMKTSGDWIDDDFVSRREPDPIEEKKPPAPLSTFEKLKALFRKESTITFPKK